jgi:hypothetical protein
MLFIATRTDEPDGVATRAAHLAYVGGSPRADGALLARDQKSALASLLVIEAQVASLLAEDPYAKAQLFASADVKPRRQAVGVPLA